MAKMLKRGEKQIESNHIQATCTTPIGNAFVDEEAFTEQGWDAAASGGLMR